MIDVDGHNYPNLALMKLSAWHKAQGDTVEWWWGFDHYDRIYMSRVFDDTYTEDEPEPVNGDEIVRGGTGYGLDNRLPDAVEHIMPDYGLYHWMPKNTAYGFLTRGCPRGCAFCIVAQKEGRNSKKVADLGEWWDGQENIELLDPNTLACPDHLELLEQLARSRAKVNFSQGLDARLLNEANIEAINKIFVNEIHFAWDRMEETKAVLRGLELYRSRAKHRPHGQYGTVYVLTNFDTSMEDNLARIYTLRELGYDPYVMVYDKPNAPQEIRDLQRWCNNRLIFKKCPDFSDYKRKVGGKS